MSNLITILILAGSFLAFIVVACVLVKELTSHKNKKYPNKENKT